MVNPPPARFPSVSSHYLVEPILSAIHSGEFSERMGEVHGPPRVQYLNLCCVLQPGEVLGRSGRVCLTDEQKRILLELDKRKVNQQKKARPRELPSSPMSVNFLADSGNTNLKRIFARILTRLKDTRGSIHDYFTDFDSRKVVVEKARPTTANITKSRGCVSRTQYERCMHNLHKSSDRLNAEDLAVLFRKYEKKGEFNYYVFVRDLEKMQQMARNDRVPMSPMIAAVLGFLHLFCYVLAALPIYD